MHTSYKKLWILLIEKNMTKSELRKKAKLSTGVFTRLNKEEDVSLAALKSICEILSCDIGDICSLISNDKNTEREG
ncbi:MAG: helix-turn-helix transcriptional regulator [Sedimentibacter sp.]|uniref:helix-turn-helix domain-containing protein n=1 Tax=Sedimentibacter sp. TaxID=1960295 RepID=UPI0031581069